MLACGEEALGDLVGLHIALRGAQGVGLGLAAPLGYRLREVREQDGEPEDHGDGQDEARLLIGDARQRKHEQDRREYGGNEHHEHDRILHLVLGIQLRERIAYGTARLRFRVVLFQCGSCHGFSHLTFYITI